MTERIKKVRRARMGEITDFFADEEIHIGDPVICERTKNTVVFDVEDANLGRFTPPRYEVEFQPFMFFSELVPDQETEKEEARRRTRGYLTLLAVLLGLTSIGLIVFGQLLAGILIGVATCWVVLASSIV